MTAKAERIQFVVFTGRRQGRNAMQQWADATVRRKMMESAIDGECTDITNVPKLPTPEVSNGDRTSTGPD